MTDFNEDIYIAAKQVSQYVLGTQYEEVGNEYIYYDRNKQETTISMDDNRLVKTPGFEILLTNIDDVDFEIEDRKIMMKIERNEKQYSFFINFAKEYQEDVFEEME